MDIKKLKALYEEYKKIGQPKGYDKGGKVPEHDKKNLKKLNDSFGKFLQEEGSEKGYSDGGDVQPSTNDKQQGFFDSVKQAFGFPDETKTPVKSNLDKKLDRVRAHNTAARDNNVGGYGSVDNSPSGYADGGEVENNSKSLTPEEFEKHLQDLKDQGLKVDDVEGEPININATLAKNDENPSKIEDIEDKENLDNKSVETPYDSEEQEADIKSDNTKDKDKDSSDEDDKEENKDESRDPADEEQKDQDNQDAQQKGYADKPENITNPAPSPKNDLAEAMRQRDLRQNLQDIGKYATILGSGVARTNSQPYLNAMTDRSQEPVQDYQMKLANQQNDPNSPISKVVGQYLQTKGFNLPPGTSAANTFKVMPFLQKDQALQGALQKVMLQQGGAQKRSELSNKTKTEIADANRQAAMERQKVANQGHVAAAKAGQESKMAKETRDAQVKAESDLTSTRGKQALQMAQRNLMSVKNAQKMVEEFPDTNKWTPSQVALFNSEIAKIATGGVPTEAGLQELSNPTAASHMAGFASKIINVPVGADQGKFIALNKKYLDGLGDVSQKTIKDNMGNVIKSYEDKLGPDKYKSLLYRHSDMLGMFSPAQERGINAVIQAKGLSREDAIKGLVQQGALKDVNY